MASFKNLIFFALAVFAVSATAEEGARVKKHAYIAAAPAPVLGYSVKAPGSFSYAYSSAAYPSYSYSYPAAAAYPAATAYAAYPASYAAYPAGYAAYPGYAHDDGKYWPGKYEKAYVPAAYPSYAHDDGKYWPGKYEKAYVPAAAAYHY